MKENDHYNIHKKFQVHGINFLFKFDSRPYPQQR